MYTTYLHVVDRAPIGVGCSVHYLYPAGSRMTSVRLASLASSLSLFSRVDLSLSPCFLLVFRYLWSLKIWLPLINTERTVIYYCMYNWCLYSRSYLDSFVKTFLFFFSTLHIIFHVFYNLIIVNIVPIFLLFLRNKVDNLCGLTPMTTTRT